MIRAETGLRARSAWDGYPRADDGKPTEGEDSTMSTEPITLTDSVTPKLGIEVAQVGNYLAFTMRDDYQTHAALWLDSAGEAQLLDYLTARRDAHGPVTCDECQADVPTADASCVSEAHHTACSLHPSNVVVSAS